MTVEITCPKCKYSKQVAEYKIRPGVRWATCPRCSERFDFTLDLERVGPENKGRVFPPWERRAETGLRKGIFQTAKQVIFSPRMFFKGTASEGGIRDPIAFGILFGSMGLMLELFWQFLMGEGSLSPIELDLIGDHGTSLIFMAAAMLCPVAATLMICITSLIIHVLLSAVGGAKSGFEATLRAVSYSQAAQFWTLIPYVGGLIASFWVVVVQLIGIREIHEVSYPRVLIAFFIPVALVIAVIVAAGVSFMFLD